MTFVLHRLLEETASRRPDHVAIESREGRLTYGELEAQSAALASCLRDLGVGRGDRVGLHARKSIRALVSLFAILRAGAAYVPLDPGAPPRRVARMIADARMRALVSSRDLAGRLETEGASVGATVLVDDAPAGHGPASGTAIAWSDALRWPVGPRPAAIDTDLAYVLYTSGSTGVPKGVAIDHRASLTFVSWACRRFALGPEDRVTSHAPLHFDLSTFDVLASVAAGATIVLVPEGTATFPPRFSELLERARITVTYLVPSALSLMAERGALEARDLGGLRAVLFAGEVMAMKHLRTWLERAPRARFYNLYGPTETNVCTFLEVDRADARTRTEPLSIGAPIENVDAFVVGPEGEVRSEVGATGELWVRGSGLARGYFGDPERTARSFVPSPLHPDVREPAYRTGDLVRIEPDGGFQFLGRLDHQIKTRGHRVELGEIETALLAHPAVTAAVAVAVPDAAAGHLVHAFVTLAEGASAGEDELARRCRDELPAYMVPQRIVAVAAMPLTSSGKVDRRALVALADGEEAAE